MESAKVDDLSGSVETIEDETEMSRYVHEPKLTLPKCRTFQNLKKLRDSRQLRAMGGHQRCVSIVYEMVKCVVCVIRLCNENHSTDG